MSSKEYFSERACSPVNRVKRGNGVRGKRGSGDTRGDRNDHISCFTYEALKKIATAYNRSYAMKEGIEPIEIYSSKKKLWNAIKKKMDESDTCVSEGEWCWIRQPFVKNIKDTEINLYTFKPPIPKGKYDWLSTEDIDNVMKQYTNVIPTFKFLGTWPIDFMDLARRTFITDFSIPKLISQGYKHIGLVLNEDNSYQSGSHWVAVMIDIPDRQIQFYDSYADPPLKEVKQWAQIINDSLPNNQKKFEIVWNDVRHQYANSECGVYSIHFLVLRALGVPFRSVVTKAISDEKMNAKRKEFFNPYNRYDNSI